MDIHGKYLGYRTSEKATISGGLSLLLNHHSSHHSSMSSFRKGDLYNNTANRSRCSFIRSSLTTAVAIASRVRSKLFEILR
jgi:hypothetical protein